MFSVIDIILLLIRDVVRIYTYLICKLLIFITPEKTMGILIKFCIGSHNLKTSRDNYDLGMTREFLKPDLQ